MNVTLRSVASGGLTRKSVVFLAVVLLYRLVVDLGYLYFVSPTYSYAGFVVSIGPEKLVLSYLITALLGVSLPFSGSRPGNFLTNLLNLFVLVPLLSLWALKDQSTEFMLMALLALAIIAGMSRVRMRALDTPPVGNIAFWALVLFLSFGCWGLLVARGGIQFIQPEWNALYEKRGRVHTELLTGVLAYFVLWWGKVINPLLIVLFASKRRATTVVLLIALQLVLFQITTHKEFVVYPFLALFVFYLDRARINLSIATYLVAILVIGFAMLLHLVVGKQIVASLVLQRALFATAVNHFEYYQFFVEHPLVGFSNSVLSEFARYPYNAPVPEIIGFERYGEGVTAFANTGFIASGYMQLGVFGVLLYAGAVGILISAYNALLASEETRVIGLPVATIGVFQLVNADLPTAVLSHGIGLGLLVLWLLHSRRSERHFIATMKQAI